MSPRSCAALLALFSALATACGDHDAAPADATADAADAATIDVGDADGSGDPDTGDDADAAPSGPIPEQATLRVLLDGEPAPDTVVIQGGTGVHYLTGDDGTVEVALDLTVEGEIGVSASHPEARNGHYTFTGDPGGVVTIELERYDTSDNPEYPFADPGEPSRRNTTAQCGHCHQTINDAWFASPHRTSASNPAVLDLYTGAISAAESNEQLCEALGGRMLPGRAPGTGGRARRCYLGDGVLHAFNPGCGEASGCESEATAFSDCADCHAPAIGGELGGRDLLAARDIAFDYGVSCDVCHRVDRIDLSAPPGVGGRLVFTRPSEPGSAALGAGGYQPLTFGPSHDVPNPRMGVVQRDHFREATLCAGCHEQVTHEVAPGLAIDAARWPDGLPVQSTFSEWMAGPMHGVAMCQDCHMPPQPETANHADLDRFPLSDIGIQGGWLRPPGSQRMHAWFGPRQPESRMLELAAALFVEREVAGDELRATVTVRNVGAGHAIPTGVPMRSMVLHVSARCGDTELTAIGGDAIDDVGGATQVQEADGDWTRWDAAQPGMVVRVTRRTGDWHGYDGVGPFGDGTFTGAAAGLPVELVVGERIVTSVDAGVASFDAPLPDGDVAYLVPAPGPLADGAATPWLAGAPGFSFARVTAGVDGTRRVPHFVATDIVRDNRLMPQTGWTSTHVFASTCAEPVVDARLLYFPYEHNTAAQRRWAMPARVIAEVSR